MKQKNVINRVLKKGREFLRQKSSAGGADGADTVNRLEALARSARAACATVEKHKPALQRVRDGAERLGKAWCGSWLGYHSRIFKSDLQPKRPGDYFDPAWGMEGAFSNRSQGQWSEFDFEQLRDAIYTNAEVDFDSIRKEIREVGNVFDVTKKQAHALLAAASRDDDYLKGIAKEIGELTSHLDPSVVVSVHVPKGLQIRTSDMRALNDGIQTPPHVDADACAVELLSYEQSCKQLAAALETAATYLMARLPANPAAGGRVLTDEEHSMERVLRVLERFHAVHTQLRRRYANRPTLAVHDEYDVQDLLHALLKVDFEAVRPEEWAPSYAGKSTRADFLLKGKGIFIEAKITGDGRAEKQIGQELSVDFAYYRGHPECKVLVCFVYDPEFRISNHRGFQDDPENLSNDEVQVVVRVYPSP